MRLVDSAKLKYSDGHARKQLKQFYFLTGGNPPARSPPLLSAPLLSVMLSLFKPKIKHIML